MPTMPVPTDTDITIQSNTTGEIDYLQFQGSTLIRSDAVTYTGPGWNVVAQGDFGGPSLHDLVLQNQSTGFVDILQLDATGKLVGSVMSNVPVPQIVGQGFFNDPASGQVGPTLVSQLPNGELDMLAFNGSGQLIHTDTVANTAGLAPVVGVGEGYYAFQLFAGVGTGNNDSVVVQLANGSLDDIGISGDFGASTLTFSASMGVPGTDGMAPVQAVNQEEGSLYGNGSIPGGLGSGSAHLEGVQFVQQLANGAFNAVYADSGYGDAAHQGTLYASNQLNLAMPGWHVVDAGGVATEIFPIT